MAQRNETIPVKLMLLGTPMIGDICFGDLAAMTQEERESAYTLRACWRSIADNFEAQSNDPLLFPAKMSDEEMMKMPPTALMGSEMDIFITDTTR